MKRANTGFSISHCHSCPIIDRGRGFRALAKNACIYFELSPRLQLNSDRRGLSNSSSRDATQSLLAVFHTPMEDSERDSSLFIFRSLVSYESDSNIAKSDVIFLVYLLSCYYVSFNSRYFSVQFLQLINEGMHKLLLTFDTCEFMINR